MKQILNKVNQELRDDVIDKIIDNGFRIVRHCTKHRKDFHFNEFERPLSVVEFFRLLAESNIQLSMYDCYNYMHQTFVTNYFEKQHSTIKVVVSRNRAEIILDQSTGDKNILLNYGKFTGTFSWFKEEHIYDTDYKS